MEVIATALIAIILIVAGAIAFMYFYGMIQSSYVTVLSRLTAFQFDRLIEGIPTKITTLYPPTACDYNYSMYIIQPTYSSNITIVVHNVLAYQTYGNGICSIMIRPWLITGRGCINVTFFNITCKDVEYCLSNPTSTCVIRIYSLFKGENLEGYIETTVRTLIFYNTSVIIESELLRLCGFNSTSVTINTTDRSVIVRIIFYEVS